MKQTYIRCPRCELNYILKKDKFCNVCKMEMKAQGSLGYDDDSDMELCPICKINYITSDEDMCPSCAKEHDEDAEQDENLWTYNDEVNDEDGYSDDENGDMVSIGNLNTDGGDDIMTIDDDDDDTSDLADAFDDDDTFDDDEEEEEEVEPNDFDEDE